MVSALRQRNDRRLNGRDITRQGGREGQPYTSLSKYHNSIVSPINCKMYQILGVSPVDFACDQTGPSHSSSAWFAWPCCLASFFSISSPASRKDLVRLFDMFAMLAQRCSRDSQSFNYLARRTEEGSTAEVANV